MKDYKGRFSKLLTLSKMECAKFESDLLDELLSLRLHAKHFTLNSEDADDLVQETVLKALRFSQAFKQGTNFKGWLYTIMRNTFVDSYHAKTKRNGHLVQVDDLSSMQLCMSASRNMAESKMFLTDIQDAIAKLKEELYLPVSLYFKGYRYEEISKYLAVPIGTVKTRIHMARKILKRTLLPYRCQLSA